jgi:hypothetical protein
MGGSILRNPAAIRDSKSSQNEFASAKGLVDALPVQTIAERNAEIREKWSKGATGIELGFHYGLCISAISKICKGMGHNIERNEKIRKRFAQGDSYTEIASDNHLTPQAIRYICRGLERKPE